METYYLFFLFLFFNYNNACTLNDFCKNVEGGDWETYVPNTWNGIFDSLTNKFKQLSTSLNHANNIINDVECADKSMLKSTEESLKRLNVNWAELIHYKNVNQECQLKIVQLNHCQCDGKWCVGYCTNVVHGCFYTLAENIQAPWKHAVNSVRTAIRLLHTQQGCVSSKSSELEFLMNNMNAWREPFNWIDSVCDFYSTDNCYDGELFNSTYKKQVTTWSSKLNPEFQLPFETNEIIMVAREQLLNVTRTLEKYWPVQRVESVDYEGVSDEEYLHEDEGSGSGFYQSTFETDDEDLLNESEGSGSSPEIIKIIEINNSIPSCHGNKYILLFTLLLLLLH